MHVYEGGAVYVLCSTGWQQLEIILFVARDTVGEKCGIPLTAVADPEGVQWVRTNPSF